MADDSQPAAKPAPPPRRGFSIHVVRIAKVVLARAEAALKPLDLTPMAFETMMRILEGEGLSQKELSEQLDTYAPKMVGLIDGLEQRGLVERRISAADRRRHSLLLTAEGRRVLERAALAAEALEQELFGSLSAKDSARFEALAQRLEDDERKRAARGA